MSRDIGDRTGRGNWHMPARPRIPNPEDGPLQAFAYDLRQLGDGKVSVAWIAGHEETVVSRAALYAALSGARLPTMITLMTLLRWWAGDPADETPDPVGRYEQSPWAWLYRLPSVHPGRKLTDEWMIRRTQLAREIENARESRPKTPRVVIAVPSEQERFIGELHDLISKTGLQDDRWLLFGPMALRVERYLAGEVIPTDGVCWEIVQRCRSFAPGLDLLDARRRLIVAAEVARTARARDRRIARRNRTNSGSAST
ncbi:hypothetical protein [Streptomyces sp. NPDC096152]|uniref:hypothetical protein n=1 Tax=Streptomyces sp. NPDC096152 TaxID=3366078 RepID=UPI0037FF8A43